MTQIPIACSLGSNDMKSRRDEWRSLLAPNLVDRNRIPGGVRMLLKASPGTKEELERLIALENACCAWINWNISEGSVLEVDATAEQEAGVTQLREWFDPAR